jgi:hypothetical protein
MPVFLTSETAPRSQSNRRFFGSERPFWRVEDLVSALAVSRLSDLQKQLYLAWSRQH